MTTRYFLVPALLLLAGCVSAPALPPADPHAAPFPAIAFFSGRSSGMATLRVIFHHPVPVRVESMGRIEADGSLTLEQRITEGSKAPRTRTWHIRDAGAGRLTGTLTPDAVGSVVGREMPGRLALAFPMKGGFAVSQELALSPDGRSARNILSVRKFGIRVAVLEEVIRKRD